MDRKIGRTRDWPVWTRLLVTVTVLTAACALQLPLENEIPGEPFLLFLLLVVGATLAFGAGVGFVAVGLSTLLSILFFEPVGGITLTHASDLIKIELYAVLAGGCVVVVSTFAHALVAAGDKNKDLERLDVNRSLLLRELAHGVANNFATVAALIMTKSASVSDAKAKMALEEAIEQVRVMARVHRRLRANSQDVSLDSGAFIDELCGDLNAVAHARSISIECKADSRPLCMDDAVTLGLIVNELVTNAIKHAFPDSRSGHIRVGFEALDHDQVRLIVRDDGVGLHDTRPEFKGSGEGHALLERSGECASRNLGHRVHDERQFIPPDYSLFGPHPAVCGYNAALMGSARRCPMPARIFQGLRAVRSLHTASKPTAAEYPRTMRSRPPTSRQGHHICSMGILQFGRGARLAIGRISRMRRPAVDRRRADR